MTWSSQRSLHDAPNFRLLLKVAVNGTHQCDFPNFCGQQCPTNSAEIQEIEPLALALDSVDYVRQASNSVKCLRGSRRRLAAQSVDFSILAKVEKSLRIEFSLKPWISRFRPKSKNGFESSLVSKRGILNFGKGQKIDSKLWLVLQSQSANSPI